MEGARQSATVTLVDSEQLEALASFCEQLSTSELSLAHLQQYSRNNEKYLFDLKQVLLESNVKGEMETIWLQLCKVERHTPRFANIALTHCNGLSVYLFGKNETLNNYYKQLSWYRATRFHFSYK